MTTISTNNTVTGIPTLIPIMEIFALSEKEKNLMPHQVNTTDDQVNMISQLVRTASKHL